MKKKIQTTPAAINLAQLSELARKNPKYARMFAGLAQIDNSIKKFVEEIVCNLVGDSSIYYIKTELESQCYNLYLYNGERRVTVGMSWLLVDFLQKCEDKTIEYEMNDKVSRMIKMFDKKDLNTNKVNWLI
jgi:uncharacterized protein YdcH (DUF465 family)